MKKWYSFYALARTSVDLICAMDDKLKLDSIKLQQIGAEIQENNEEEKLHQVGAENVISLFFRFCCPGVIM